MKTFFVALAALSLIPQAFAQNSGQDLCSRLTKEYQKHYRSVSCQPIDWSVKPISSDYQQTSLDPITSLSGQIKNQDTGETVYRDDYPYVRNMEYYFNYQGKGVSVATKFVAALSRQEQKDGDSSGTATATANWYHQRQETALAKSKAGTLADWEGKCGPWSGWNPNPELQSIFDSIKYGVICEGIPFSRGELKEIVTSLYPEPLPIERKSAIQFYRGYLGQTVKNRADANVALSKLGLLGGGDLAPADYLAFAEKAKKAGMNLMLDRDPGTQVWQQPVVRMADVAYGGPSPLSPEMTSTADLEFRKDGDTSGAAVLILLRLLEKDFAVNLVRQNGVPNSRLCSIRKLLHQNCDDLNASLSLSEQVDQFQALKQEALRQKLVQVKEGGMVQIKHQLVIEYAEENPYASAQPDHTSTLKVDYVAIQRKNSDGSAGELVRSQWAPKTSLLSEACHDGHFKGSISSLTGSQKEFDRACAALKNGEKDFAVFTGDLPPGMIQSFKAKPYFPPGHETEAKAYQAFLDHIATCPKFDDAVDFFTAFQSALLDNVISDREADELKASYPKVKEMIDHDWLSQWMDHQGSAKGMADLKRQLLAL